MDDLISRRAAIRAYCEHECGKGMIRGECGCDDCGTIFDGIPSAQPEPQWIPCSERLPEESDLYCVSGKGKVWICEFHIIPNFIGGWRNDVSNPVVKAWIPLPEPYKEERKDDEQT